MTNYTNSNGNHANGDAHSDGLRLALPIPELMRIGRETPELEKVEEYARALARTVKNEPYDPQNPDDKLHEEKFQKDRDDCADAEKAAAHARVNLKDGERKAAELQHNLQEEPKLPWKIVATAMGVIAISIGFTLHDVFFAQMEDQAISWILAMGGGLVIGALVTWAVGAIHDPSGQRSTINLAGLIGGLGVGIAGFLLRLAGGDMIIGLALTLLEFSAVALVELYAAPLRERYRLWHTARENCNQALAVVKSLQDEASRRNQTLQESKAHIDHHKGYVSFRTFCHQKFPEIEAAAVQIATQAYLEKRQQERDEQQRREEEKKRREEEEKMRLLGIVRKQ